MKRSDIVTLIEGLLDCGQDYSKAVRAENMLAHLEQAGMLPEKRKVKDGNSWYCVWEPEDQNE